MESALRGAQFEQFQFPIFLEKEAKHKVWVVVITSLLVSQFCQILLSVRRTINFKLGGQMVKHVYKILLKK